MQGIAMQSKLKTPQSSANICVIGAGLMGRLIAFSLVKQGHEVTLLDRDSKSAKNSAAYAAAGLLTPLGEAMHSEPNIVEMGFKSLKLWPEILSQLSGYTYFQQAGAIMVSHEQDQGDYQRFVRYIDSHYPQHTCQQLNREALIELEPELGRSFHQGVYLPEEGQIDNRKLLIALKEELEQLKVGWVEHANVTAIEQHGETCVIRYQENDEIQTLACDFTIDCRGIGARQKDSSVDAAPLADLRGVRGELFQLFAPQVTLNRPIRLMHPRYQLYIAPKTQGFYVVGATEIESDDNTAMTVRASMELLSAAYSVHPGFAEANIRQHISQLRPAFHDNQPKITVQNKLIQVNGLYRHGFLIAPVILAQTLYAIDHQLSREADDALECSPFHDLVSITKNQMHGQSKFNNQPKFNSQYAY